MALAFVIGLGSETNYGRAIFTAAVAGMTLALVGRAMGMTPSGAQSRTPRLHRKWTIGSGALLLATAPATWTTIADWAGAIQALIGLGCVMLSIVWRRTGTI